MVAVATMMRNVFMLSRTIDYTSRSCTHLCTSDVYNPCWQHGPRKADLRISIKEYRNHKKLKILLFRTPFAMRQCSVRINGAAWPKDRRALSLTRLLTGVRKALVRAA
jgi:hypothetical protein